MIRPLVLPWRIAAAWYRVSLPRPINSFSKRSASGDCPPGCGPRSDRSDLSRGDEPALNQQFRDCSGIADRRLSGFPVLASRADLAGLPLPRLEQLGFGVVPGVIGEIALAAVPRVRHQGDRESETRSEACRFAASGR